MKHSDRETYIYIFGSTTSRSGFPRRYASGLKFGHCRMDKPGLFIGLLVPEFSSAPEANREGILWLDEMLSCSLTATRSVGDKGIIHAGDNRLSEETELDNVLAKILLKNAAPMVSAIRASEDVSELGMLMMNIEVEFGRFEAEDIDGSDKERLVALELVWRKLSSLAVEQAIRIGFEPNSIDRQRIESDLYDNYFHAAVAGVAAARIHEPAKSLPLLAWAAFNKHSYRGYKDEIAVLRMLLGAGYDPNAQDCNGMTALHYMASMQTYPFSHPRAVRLLIEAGANPNIQNERGDSPLCYLAGNRQWTDELNYSAILLLDAGANPRLAANDGATPLGLLKENCDDSQREAIIFAIERTIA